MPSRLNVLNDIAINGWDGWFPLLPHEDLAMGDVLTLHHDLTPVPHPESVHGLEPCYPGVVLYSWALHPQAQVIKLAMNSFPTCNDPKWRYCFWRKIAPVKPTSKPELAQRRPYCPSIYAEPSPLP